MHNPKQNYPAATLRLLPEGLNHTTGGNQPRLIIAHMMQGTLAGTDSWFHNSISQVSSHFGIGRDGTVIEWVKPEDQAWQAGDANNYSIGVECEGWSGEPYSSDQLDQFARLYAWCHVQYPDIELWMNTRPFTGHGISWHGLGGKAWGNHPDCPGAPAVHQLNDILLGAKDVHAQMLGEWANVETPDDATNPSKKNPFD